MLPPSTAPCFPAPGRRLLIIRNDNQAPSANLFLGFDGLMSLAMSQKGQANAYKRRSLLNTATKSEVSETVISKSSSDGTTTPTKKRWTFMGKMLPANFASTTNSDPQTSNFKRVTSPTRTLEEARRETALARARPSLHAKKSSSDSETPPATSAYRAFSFKFSLEWAQHFEKPTVGGGNRGSSGGAGGSPERRMSTPRLPAPAQAWLSAKVPGTSTEIVPKDPNDSTGSLEAITRAKYAGRALAEWALIVQECNNFVDRRRMEGVPSLKWVEVPTLGVEGFRKFG